PTHISTLSLHDALPISTIDVELTVGQITTAVEVQAAAPLLNATSATLGQVIENRYINELPLIARNPYTLTYLTPGIVGSAGSARSEEHTSELQSPYDLV